MTQQSDAAVKDYPATSMTGKSGTHTGIEEVQQALMATRQGRALEGCGSEQMIVHQTSF